jgi:hypothetical protein
VEERGELLLNKTHVSRFKLRQEVYQPPLLRKFAEIFGRVETDGATLLGNKMRKIEILHFFIYFTTNI